LKRNLKIAIDGPAASGKSTTAKMLAKRLGYLYIDTGAMYRAVTLAVLRSNITLNDVNAIVDLVDRLDIELKQKENGIHTYLNKEDVSEEIRLPKITAVISQLSAYAQVREIMVKKQRVLAQKGGIIMDGRDIGTVVLPDADVKIFMQADINKRAKRRYDELKDKGLVVDYNEIKTEINRRDSIDSSRNISPLKPAHDAYIIDTSNLSIEQQVAQVIDIIKRVEERINNKNP
jgi:cytidylate kinase